MRQAEGEGLEGRPLWGSRRLRNLVSTSSRNVSFSLREYDSSDCLQLYEESRKAGARRDLPKSCFLSPDDSTQGARAFARCHAAPGGSVHRGGWTGHMRPTGGITVVLKSVGCGARLWGPPLLTWG